MEPLEAIPPADQQHMERVKRAREKQRPSNDKIFRLCGSVSFCRRGRYRLHSQDSVLGYRQMTLKEREVHAARMRIKNAQERIDKARLLPKGERRAERIREIWREVEVDRFTVQEFRRTRKLSKAN
jgi:hypothetical protein